MKAILQNSTNFSQASDTTNARLLIDHIKRIVEDDMKSTVEAFKFIESEIDVELNTTFSKKKTDNKITRKETSGVQSPNYSSHPKQPEYNIDPRISFPSNAYPTTRLSSKGVDSRNSLPNNLHLDSTTDNEMSQINNYMNKCSSNIRLEDSKLDARDDQNEFPFSSTDNDLIDPSEATTGLNTDYRLYSDDISSKLQAVQTMYIEFKEEFKSIVNKILERYAEDPSGSAKSIDKAARQSTTNKMLSNSYGHFPQSSYATSSRPSSNNNKNRKTMLPQLLAFGDNRGNSSGKSCTIIGDRYAQRDTTNELTEKNYRASNTIDLSSKRTSNVPEKNTEFQPINQYDLRTQIIEEKIGRTAEERELNELLLLETTYTKTVFNNTSNLTSEWSDQLVKTVDFNNSPRNETNYSNNEVTLTDVEDEDEDEDERSTENTFTQDEELTDAISSSLLATPKTVEASSREYTDLDEIAMLISRASPDRRVIIKKKVPEVTTKGYNKNCNEKLIFSGNKITHVKTDRKTMCRDYYPKRIEN